MPSSGTSFRSRAVFQEHHHRRAQRIDHSIPGTTVQFIMMMVLIYGGIAVHGGPEGILARLLFAAFDGLALGQLPRVLADGFARGVDAHRRRQVVFPSEPGGFSAVPARARFALAMAALGVSSIGSMARKEDMIVGLAVLLANILAGAGGLLVAGQRDRRARHPESGDGLAGLLGDGRVHEFGLNGGFAEPATRPRALAGASP